MRRGLWYALGIAVLIALIASYLLIECVLSRLVAGGSPPAPGYCALVYFFLR